MPQGECRIASSALPRLGAWVLLRCFDASLRCYDTLASILPCLLRSLVTLVTSIIDSIARLALSFCASTREAGSVFGRVHVLPQVIEWTDIMSRDMIRHSSHLCASCTSGVLCWCLFCSLQSNFFRSSITGHYLDDENYKTS